MQNSYLYLLCKKLSKVEWRRLVDFAASPLHNTREDVGQLLAYLEHYLPKIKASHLEKENIWQRLFPKKEYDDAAMRYLTHLAYQVVKDFLSWENNKQHKIQQQLQLLHTLRQQKSDERIWEKELKDTSQMIDKQSFRGFDFYENTFTFHQERFDKAVYENRSATEGFQDWADALNVFFVAQKLRQGCLAVSLKAISTTDLRIDFLQETLDFVAKKEEIQEIPLVSLYYQLYLSLVDIQEDTYFEKAKKILFSEGQLFDETQLREFYVLAINACIRRLNAAKMNYIEEVFDIYRKGLEINVLIENGLLSRFTYNNIVMAGVRLKEFTWTEDFIHLYKPFLEEKHQESVFNHVLATFYFKKQDFGKAMQLLQQVEFNDVLHNLDARRMLLCIYYDLGEWAVLDTHLDAFKTYLYRQKDLGYHRESCLNLIYFTNQLLHLNFSKPNKINDLRIKIEKCENVFEKEWLLKYLE